MKTFCAALILALATSAPAVALADDDEIELEDPAGDDFGPGTYKYPTDAVYKRGTFDLREVELEDKGSTVEIEIEVSARVEDPWDSKSWPQKGNGFSLQFVQLYIDVDGKAGSGHTDALPGLNAGFAPEDAWDKVILISPQNNARLKSEVETKAPKMAKSVVYPTKVKVRGKKIIATVRKKDLGGAPSKAWGYQAVMQSNEGYPKANDLLTRKVNELAGQHRFGGGSDWECDPHVIDILVAPAKGRDDEKEAQKKALEYKCGAEGKSEKRALLPMVRLK